MQEIDKVDNYYRLEHVNGDFRVVTEFNAETADELFPYIAFFLRGCSWTDGIIEEHMLDV